MHKRTFAVRLVSLWPLLVIVSAIFMAGWTIKAALSAEINNAALAVEARVNARLDRDLSELRLDVRAIREAIAPLTYQRKGP